MRTLNRANLGALVPRHQRAQPLHCTPKPFIVSAVGRGGWQQDCQQVVACVILHGAGLGVNLKHEVKVGLVEVAHTRVEHSLVVPLHRLPVEGPCDMLIIH
eukprot:8597807-Alexandrium_andersonii.AAC.1